MLYVPAFQNSFGVNDHGEMPPVGTERALRMAGGPRGIDDERRRVGRELPRESLETLNRRLVVCGAGCQHGAEADELVMPVREHGARIDDHDMAHERQPLHDRQHLVDVLLVLGDHDAGAAVAQLVFGLRRRRGGVNAVGHCPERLRRQVREHPLLAGVADDRDALGTREAESFEPVGDSADERGILSPAPTAIDAELLGAICNRIRRPAGSLREHAGCGLAAQRVTH